MSDHELTIISLILAIFGIVVGILTGYYFYLKAKERIDPQYILRYGPFAGNSSGAMKNISVLFKGVEIGNLNRCIVAIWNRGNRVIMKDAIAKNDEIKVHLPEGAIALGAGVAWSRRPAINLSTQISENKSTTVIDFDFLDQGDGGIIEILYQDKSKISPTLTGSIIGAPRGIQSVPMSSDDEDETKNESSWKSLVIEGSVLCILTVVSAIRLGPIYPPTIVLYVVITEAIAVGLWRTFTRIYLHRKFGSLDFLSGMPKEAVEIIVSAFSLKNYPGA